MISEEEYRLGYGTPQPRRQPFVAEFRDIDLSGISEGIGKKTIKRGELNKAKDSAQTRYTNPAIQKKYTQFEERFKELEGAELDAGYVDRIEGLISEMETFNKKYKPIDEKYRENYMKDPSKYKKGDLMQAQMRGVDLDGVIGGVADLDILNNPQDMATFDNIVMGSTAIIEKQNPYKAAEEAYGMLQQKKQEVTYDKDGKRITNKRTLTTPEEIAFVRNYVDMAMSTLDPEDIERFGSSTDITMSVFDKGETTIKPEREENDEDGGLRYGNGYWSDGNYKFVVGEGSTTTTDPKKAQLEYAEDAPIKEEVDYKNISLARLNKDMPIKNIDFYNEDGDLINGRLREFRMYPNGYKELVIRTRDGGTETLPYNANREVILGEYNLASSDLNGMFDQEEETTVEEEGSVVKIDMGQDIDVKSLVKGKKYDIDGTIHIWDGEGFVEQ